MVSKGVSGRSGCGVWLAGRLVAKEEESRGNIVRKERKKEGESVSQVLLVSRRSGGEGRKGKGKRASREREKGKYNNKIQ